MSDVKVYHLLPHMAPTAPMFIRLSKEKRVRIDTLPQWQPHLQYTVTDSKGNNRTIRLKLNSNTIFLDEQIEKGIPANAKPTMAERDAVKFKNGVRAVNLKIVNDFLAAIPENEDSPYKSLNVRKASFKLHDQTKVVEEENTLFEMNLKAANKISGLKDMKAAQDLLISIFGTHYKVPTTLSECKNALIRHMDSSEKAVEDILKDDFSADEEITILLGRLVDADMLSFTKTKGQVSKKKGDKWINVKSISSEYAPKERERQFAEFLLTPAGLTLKADLENDLKNIGKEKTSAKKKPELINT